MLLECLYSSVLTAAGGLAADDCADSFLAERAEEEEVYMEVYVDVETEPSEESG